ncbi:Anaphase promoting complex 10 isoform 1 [Hibiscus syriacus]|uniref:Anaphase promoting complex 10 isoform 1 n=1 Tax=Hibiscus syriacus TaxID=106335 RepID=A0A6A3AK68_HIBSY|nr:Anaphase promoting complex 10 isoform 1 [Hibiscus syriacus]
MLIKDATKEYSARVKGNERWYLENLKERWGKQAWHSRTRSHVAPDRPQVESECVEQSPWANLPPELLLDIIHRVEESETAWPARAAVVFCAAVCRYWREITKEVVKTPEQCGMLTFPISLKQGKRSCKWFRKRGNQIGIPDVLRFKTAILEVEQRRVPSIFADLSIRACFAPGPRESSIQCYIKRDRATSTYLLFYGLVPSEGESDKLLLAARRSEGQHAQISLYPWLPMILPGPAIHMSNFLGTKFTVYDSQPPCDSMIPSTTHRRFHSKQVSPRLPACNYRRRHCPYTFGITAILDDQPSPLPSPNGKGQLMETSSPSLEVTPLFSVGSGEPLTLKTKAPRWHEQLQCWCLNFRGRVTVASVKNFQLVAAVEPANNVSPEEQDKVILQFWENRQGHLHHGFDTLYPFQAFAVCLSSFDTKPACDDSHWLEIRIIDIAMD